MSERLFSTLFYANLVSNLREQERKKKGKQEVTRREQAYQPNSPFHSPLLKYR